MKKYYRITSTLKGAYTKEGKPWYGIVVRWYAHSRSENLSWSGNPLSLSEQDALNEHFTYDEVIKILQHLSKSDWTRTDQEQEVEGNRLLLSNLREEKASLYFLPKRIGLPEIRGVFDMDNASNQATDDDKAGSSGLDEVFAFAVRIETEKGDVMFSGV